MKLPEGVASRRVATATGLDVHYLEAGGTATDGRPTLLLLHGFPELAYSWRRVIPRLAAAGYRVLAPDQRGYGRTTGATPGYDVDLAEFSMPSLVRDALAFLDALDAPHVDAVIGHDFGSPVAAWSALIRPDVFRAVACMSSPFAGPPPWRPEAKENVHETMLTLDPPRKHYQWYYGERSADRDMADAPQGLADFLRAYFHCKSGDWAGNAPHRLSGWTAEALAEMPLYYIMNADETMAETALRMAPTAEEAAACEWMTAADLAVYVEEYGRTGFQTSLNWYRRMTSDEGVAELRLFAGRRIEVPACFIAGRSDWGWAQFPGALEAMETTATADWRGTTLIDGAGHWVQQEAPEEVADAVLAFLDGV